MHTSGLRRAPRRGPLAAALLAALLGACVPVAVDWRDDARLAPGTGNVLAVDSASAPVLVQDVVMAPTDPPDVGSCRSSMRMARNGHYLHAVWWSIRADSSGHLVGSTSRDGGESWGPVVNVDSLDRSTAGCRRPAPAIVARNEWVHVAYSMDAPEGTGVFYSHSMETGDMYHWPIVITYGARLARTAVAIDGRTVVVAYEEPNSRRPRVDIAISRTDGHTFDHRLRASPSARPASDPLVAVARDVVALSYVTGQEQSIRREVRTGRLR
jgi:hypothetical protein